MASFDEFLKELELCDPVDGMSRMCDFFHEANQSDTLSRTVDNNRSKARAILFACLLAYAESHGYDLTSCKPPALQGSAEQDDKRIIDFFSIVKGSLAKQERLGLVESQKQQFAMRFGSQFFYEFSQGDLDRIQNLINELREQITSSEKLKAEHKQRVLKRLEKLQAELHKKVSDLDRFWGVLFDCFFVIEKLGESAKPLVDRVREIAGIVYGVQLRAHDLPGNLPLRLPGEKEENNKKPKSG